MAKGIIRLLDYQEELVAANVFSGKYERGKIIETWKKVYGKRINQCMFQIHLFQNKKREDKWNVPKETTDRPPSTYSNTTPFGIAKEV